MSFLSPSIPTPPSPANAPITALAPGSTQSPTQAAAAASLISTGGQGDLSQPNKQRATLLGGGAA